MEKTIISHNPEETSSFDRPSEASVLEWLIFITLSTVFFFTPYHRGLFFENETYVVIGILLICFIIVGGWSLFAGKTLNRVPAVYYGIFFIPLSYILAFPTAESPQDNFTFLFRWLAFSGYFILLLWLRHSSISQKLMPAFFQITGIGIAVLSILGYTGLVYYAGIVSEDFRLTGPIQYPNTFGTLMAAYCLYSLIMLAFDKGSFASRLLYSLPLVMFGATILLTYSRGTILVMAIAWLMGLLLLTVKNHISYLIYTLVMSIGSLIAFWIGERWHERAAWPLLMTLIISGILVLLLDWSYVKGWWNKPLGWWQTRSYTRRFGRWAVVMPIGAASILGVADIRFQGLLYRVLPASLQDKLSDIGTGTKSVLGRMEMYKDALRIFRGSPITGTGGDGWELMFSYYQTVPYYTREVHSGYLEVLVNTGLVGLICFSVAAVILGAGIVRACKDNAGTQHKAIIAATTAILMITLHAAIDFHYSFGTVWLILLWLIAMIVPVDRSPLRLSGKWRERLTGSRMQWSGQVFVIVFVTLGFLFYSWFYLNDRKVFAAETAGGARGIGLEEGLVLYESAFKRNPFSADLANKSLLAYTQRYMVYGEEADLDKMLELAEKAEKLEPHNSRLLSYIGQAFFQAGEYDRAFAYLDKAAGKEPFDISITDVNISLKLEAAVIAAADGDEDKGRQYLRMAVNDYERYRDQVSIFKNREIPDVRRLELRSDTYIAAAQAYLYLGEAYPAYRIIQHFKLAEDD